jgi:hypothetical protein
MLTMCLILAAAFEVTALRCGRCTYTASMPRLPMAAGLGLLSMLPMVVLPPLIFKVASALECRRARLLAHHRHLAVVERSAAAVRAGVRSVQLRHHVVHVERSGGC